MTSVSADSFITLRNGVRNDTFGIQTALDYLRTKGGGLLELGRRTYEIDPTIGLNIPSDVQVIGQGYETVLKIPNGTNAGGNLLRGESIGNVLISNLVLDGNRANQSSGTNYGLYLADADNCRVVNVVTKNFRGVGTQLYDCEGTVIRDSYSANNMYHGFEVEQVRGCTLQGNRGTANLLHGLGINPGEQGGTGSAGNSFIGNTFDNNLEYGIDANPANDGMSAWLSKGNIISANHIYSNGHYGITIFKNDGFTIQNNFIYNNGRFGIYLYQAQNNIVQSNILMNNSQSGNGSYDEIMLEGYSDNNAHPSKNNIIANNTILMTAVTKARYAVNEATSGDGANVITGNIVPTAGTSGTVNNQNPATVVSQPAGVLQVSNSGQAIQGANAGLDAAFTNVLRIYNNFASGETQLVNPNGPFSAYVGGTKRFEISTDGAIRQFTPGSAPGAGDARTAVMWLDEATNKLKVRVKYADGSTVKNGDVADLV